MAIPISVAQSISRQFGIPEIVIFAYDPTTGTQHVVTYGETEAQASDAAEAGNFIKRAMGWPESLCNATPEPKGQN